MKKALFLPLQVSFYTVGYLCASVPIAQAQVTTDGTVNTQVNQNGNVAEITGGETRGDNLFHSFQDFSVTTGNEAFFDNASDISNIFSRVTGGNISDIDGLIRANDSASLFLINPAGILFGNNARLDIGGSFYGSSASSILFEGGEFSAVDLDNPPLLTVNAPIGLGFRDEPGDITVRGDGNGARLEDSEVIDTEDALRVDSDATIGLLGGNVLFEDATLRTAGGRIEIGSVAEGTVDLVAVDNGFAFDYSGIETFQDISLSGRSSVDASGLGGGDIQAAGKNISIAGVSGFTSFTLGSTPGNDINIFAAESLDISGVENELNFVSAISTRAFADSMADAGNINIEVGSLSIGDRGAIISSASGLGDGGNIDINASDSITLVSQGNGSLIFSGVNTDAVGDGGDVILTANSLTLSDGAFVNTSSVGEGNAGNIAVNSSSLSVTNGSSLFANTRAQGNAGDINIDSTNIAIDDLNNAEVSTGLFSNVGTDAVGDAGNINISTESLSLSNTASINTTNSGQGDGGNIAIDATDSIVIENRDPSSLANTFVATSVSGENALGSSGDIDITTSSLSLNNGVSFFTSNSANGRAGDVTINATEDVSFSNDSQIFVLGAPGGFVDISAKNLSIASGSSLTAGINGETESSEVQAGNITISLTEDLVLDELESNNNTSISNSSTGTGNPGNIEIDARNITFQNGGNIFAFSLEQDATTIGNIALNATGDVVFDGISSARRSGVSNVISENLSGSIGDVNVTAQNLIVTNGANISSSVDGTGDSGKINLDIANSVTLDGFGDATISEDATVRLPSQISSIIFTDGTGNAGSIDIDTQSLTITNGAEISSSVNGTGNSGNININAANSVIIDGFANSSTENSSAAFLSQISSDIFSNGVGNAGTIKIDTQNLALSRNGSITALVGGQGNGGDINLNAEQITISEQGSPDIFSSSVRANILAGAEGNGGNITVDSQNFSISDEGVLTTSGSGTGNAGNITIDATNSFTLDDNSLVTSNIGSPGGEPAIGQVGNIVVTARNIAFDNGSQIQAGAFGGGTVEETGTVSLTATESISFTGLNSGIFSNNDPDSFGNASNTQLSASEIILKDGAVVQTSNAGEGNGGSVAIDANNLSLENGSTISSGTRSGIGGNITFDIAENITLRENSGLSASASEDANGGNIDIDTQFVIAFADGNNDIIASAEQGQGGNIIINAESLFGIEERSLNDLTNDINASSQVSGLDGTIEITNPDINPVQGATELPTNVVVPEETTQQACASNRQTAAKNGLDITGKGGVVPDPKLPLSPLNVANSQEANSTSTIPAPIETSQGKIQPARGIEVTKDGAIVLTAYRTNNAGDRLLNHSLNCGKV